MANYEPVDSLESPRFSGVRTFMRLPHVETTEGIDFAIIGVPFDTGATYRIGARFGPEAIRSISALLRPHNAALDVSIFDYCSGVDFGDLPVVPGYIEDSFKRIEQSLFPLVDRGVIPILLGGDHSVTLPELRAVAKKHGPLALVQFDSHTDTWDEYFGRLYNHGTTFRRGVEEGLILVDRSIQVGMRGSLYSKEDLDAAKSLGFEVITSIDGQEMGIDNLIRSIRQRVGEAKVFVSFDIDFVDPAFAPGTGTIEVGGFTSAEALRLVRGLGGLNFTGFDVVELLPPYDRSQITASLAANIAYEFISLIALRKKKIAGAQ
ncbi:MAG: agmatinase [Proteobacteria bacterium]|nr:agmatinase [Pseudomonadota bacterium]NIS69117.1 agmatinase [Pseudomonadota bacterium]